MTTGTLKVSIPARGLTAVVLDNCRIAPRFQQKLGGGSPADAWAKGLVDFDAPKGRAMVLNMGRATKTAFIYLVDDATSFEEVRLEYDTGAGVKTEVDKEFPWEFTLPLDASARRISFSISGKSQDGSIQESKKFQLSKD